MTDRYQQLLLLLRSLHDYDVTLPTSTGNIVRRQSKPGDGPSKKVPCPNCDGEKQTRRRGIQYDCTFCLSVKTGKPLGWIYVDGNINEAFQRKIGTEETGIQKGLPRSVPCDACMGLDPKKEKGEGVVPGSGGERCPYCDGTGWAKAFQQRIRPFRKQLDEALLDATDRTGEPRLDAMLRRKEAGSYDELLTALGTLRAWPDRLRNGPYLVPALLAYRSVTVLEHDNRTLDQIKYDVIVMAAFTFIEPRMPAEIRVPRWTYIEERRRRERTKMQLRRAA